MLYVLKKSRIIPLVALFCLIPFISHAQEVVKHIDLDDGVGAPDLAFGMEMSPDGEELYVAISGHYSDNNNRLVKIDTSIDEVVAEGVTELYPEEVTFKLYNDEILKIFVSNSSSHSITVLKPDLTLETHIPLVTPPAQAWPFGVIMGPDNRYLYVSTVNAGEIFVIDTDVGPTYLQIVQTYTIGQFNGRMAIHDGKLLIPSSDSALGLFLHIMDLAQPANVQSVLLTSDTSGWPSAPDVEVTDDGFAYITAYDWLASSDMYEVDLNLATPAVSRVIDLTDGGIDLTQEHGICASADGNTLIVTYLSDAHIRMVGTKTGKVLDTMHVYPQNYGEINEALFSDDGNKLYLTDQASPNVHVLTRVPEHGLILKGTSEVLPGGLIEMDLLGGENAQPGMLLMSLTEGQVSGPTYTMDLGLPFWVMLYQLFDVENEFFIPDFNCPNDSGLSGLRVYFQGLTRDADFEFRPSNLHIIDIL